MELQIALDRLSYDECFETLEQVAASIDIIEVGTGVIKEFGLGIVRDIKDKYPDKRLLADVKICDAGKSESETAFSYGADIITVMSFVDGNTLRACLDVAQAHNKEVVVDLLNNSNPGVIGRLKSSGVTSVSAHIGKDQQKNGSEQNDVFKDLNQHDFKIYVAGGIDENNLNEYLTLNPSVVIVGSGITKAADKKAKARLIRNLIE